MCVAVWVRGDAVRAMLKCVRMCMRVCVALVGYVQYGAGNSRPLDAGERAMEVWLVEQTPDHRFTERGMGRGCGDIGRGCGSDTGFEKAAIGRFTSVLHVLARFRPYRTVLSPLRPPSRPIS